MASSIRAGGARGVPARYGIRVEERLSPKKAKQLVDAMNPKKSAGAAELSQRKDELSEVEFTASDVVIPPKSRAILSDFRRRLADRLASSRFD